VGQTAVQRIEPVVTLGQSGDVLDRPKAVAVDGDGDIYIFTEADTSIRKFSPDGKAQKVWAVHNKDGSPATEISALVVKDGKLLALDAATSELLAYGLDGSGGERTQLCTCFFPRGMALSNDGNFWVADTGGSKVLKVGPDGKVIASIEGKGSEPGQFVEPASVWESPDGTVYVVDIGNARVQSFSADLKPITAWPIGSSIARDGNRISGDENGELVTEAESHAVVRYDAHGKELGRWIYEGLTGQLIPSGIAPAGGGKFVVLYPLSFVGVVFVPGK
jgi:sugar lactone lactonase YvrE